MLRVRPSLNPEASGKQTMWTTPFESYRATLIRALAWIGFGLAGTSTRTDYPEEADWLGIG